MLKSDPAHRENQFYDFQDDEDQFYIGKAEPSHHNRKSDPHRDDEDSEEEVPFPKKSKVNKLPLDKLDDEGHKKRHGKGAETKLYQNTERSQNDSASALNNDL